MEFQFALKSLKKKVVPIIVGTDNKWSNTIVGLLVSGCDVDTIDMRMTDESDYEVKFNEIMKYCTTVLDVNYQSKLEFSYHISLFICLKIFLHCFYNVVRTLCYYCHFEYI